MALFAEGAITGPISGTLGAVNFATGPHGPYIRRIASRCSYPTKAQLQHRSLWPAARAAWLALTTSQRQGWSTAAARIPIRNRLGLSSPMSGPELYIRFFIQASHLSYDVPVLPPVALTQAPLTSCTVTLASAPSCSVTCTADDLTAPANWQLFLARTCRSDPLRSAQHWRYVGQHTAFSQVYDITSDFSACFSPPQIGETWLWRARTSGQYIMPSPILSGSILAI